MSNADENDTPTSPLRGEAHGTAAMILVAHMLNVLIRRGVLLPDDEAELWASAKAFAHALSEPGEPTPGYADLVCEVLDQIRAPASSRPDGLN